MIDRFGPIPKQTVTLLHTIRLRWLARSIGFEKLVLRNQRLTAYFINNPESGYFQSDQFTAILESMKSNPSGYKMTEEKNRLFMTFRDVPGISDAIARLEPFQISKVTNI
jgi:transcription-repair coupling factor (superfamily II helicase)